MLTILAASAEDEVAWDDDDSDESEESDDSNESEDEQATPAAKSKTPAKPASVASSTTIHPPAQNRLKPNEARKSNDEKSQADSEASYDVVGAASGKTSQAPNSPKDSKKGDGEGEDSDDDWE